MKKIACIGNFDGVHLGHQLLISRVVELADDKFIQLSLLLILIRKLFYRKKQKIFNNIKAKERIPV